MLRTSRNTSVRAFEPSDVEFILNDLHYDVIEEVENSPYAHPREALLRSVQVSADVQTGLLEGEPIVIFGVGVQSLFSDTGVPWMFVTNGVQRCSTTFIRQSRAVVDGWRSRYRYLGNYVDARNTLAVRWVQWMGFDIQPVQTVGEKRIPCYLFSAGKSDG